MSRDPDPGDLLAISATVVALAVLITGLSGSILVGIGVAAGTVLLFRSTARFRTEIPTVEASMSDRQRNYHQLATRPVFNAMLLGAPIALLVGLASLSLVAGLGAGALAAAAVANPWTRGWAGRRSRRP